MIINPYLGPVPEGATIRLGKGTIADIALSPDGMKVAVGGSLGLWIYDSNTLQLLEYLDDAVQISNLRWSPSGEKLVVSTLDKMALIWDANTFEVLHTLGDDQDGL